MNRYTITLLLPLLLFLTSGCSSHRSPLPEIKTLPQTFSLSGTEQLRREWWKSFKDPELNRYIKQLLSQNLDLNASLARISQAKALLRQSKASYYPTLSLSSGQTESRIVKGNGPESTARTTGLSSAYLIDLWGQSSALVSAQEETLKATEAAYESAVIALTTQCAVSWYRYGNNTQQIKLQKKRETLETQQYRLLESKHQNGQATLSALHTLQRQRLQTDTAFTTLQSSRKSLQHSLLLLQAESPGQQLSMIPETLPQLHPLPDTGIPSERILQRPDVQQAYHTLKALNHKAAAAVLDRYPDVAITASLTSTSTPETLLNNWIGVLAGTVTAPLLDGGTRSGVIDASDAAFKEQVNLYRQTILEAWHEVETLLVEEKQLRQTESGLQQQLSLAENEFSLLRYRYQNGVSRDYSTLLEKEAAVLQLKQALLSATLERIENRIALYGALAGNITERHTTLEKKDE